MPEVSVSTMEEEFRLLGGLLRTPARIGEADALLSPEDFGSTVTREVYKALREMHYERAPIDFPVLRHRLGESYDSALQEIATRYVSDIPYYCRMLRENANLRKLKDAGFGLAYAETAEIAKGYVEQIGKLSVSRPGRECYSTKELLGQYWDGYGKGRAGTYLEWGFKELDDAIDARLGDFIVLGGYPSAGKTALSIQLALTMAKKYRVGYFSLETGAVTLTERVLAHTTGIPLRRFKQETLSESEIRTAVDVSVTTAEAQVDWLPCAGVTADAIRAEALNQQYEVIFVDYLQKIRTKGTSRYEAVTQISLQLSELAKCNSIAVIALAQLTRPEKTKGQKLVRPGMDAFKESGQIEQDADVGLLLYPEDPFDNHSPRFLDVAKNKEGERPLLKLDFDGARQKFSPHKPTANEQYRAVTQAVAKAKKERAQQMTFRELPENEGGPLPF